VEACVISAISNLKEGARVERYRDYTYFFKAARCEASRIALHRLELSKRDSQKKLTYLSEVVQLILNLR
jgi:hypothetical protein